MKHMAALKRNSTAQGKALSITFWQIQRQTSFPQSCLEPLHCVYMNYHSTDVCNSLIFKATSLEKYS